MNESEGSGYVKSGPQPALRSGQAQVIDPAANAQYFNESIEKISYRVRREFYLGIAKWLMDQVPTETWRKAVDVARDQATEMDNDYTAWPPFSGDEEDDYEEDD